MANGTIRNDFSHHSPPYALLVEWSSTPNVATNSSVVVATIKLYVPYSLYIGARSNQVITINGVNYTYNSPQVQTGSAGTFTLGTITTGAIPHNADGSKSITITCNFNVQATISGTYYGNQVASGMATLDDIPRKATIVSASNFNDGDDPKITYNNPAGSLVSSLQVGISLNNNQSSPEIAYKTANKLSDSYTFYLTDAEIKTLLTATTGSNSRRIYYHIKTVISGITSYDTVERTFTVIDGTPTINPIIYDGNSASTTLTGNSNKMIRGYNQMMYEIGAAARKEGKIVSQSISYGGKIATDPSGNLGTVNTNVFVFSATDNRGNTVSKTITLSMIEYIPLTCNVEGKIELSKTDGTKAQIEFTVSGNYFKGSFGAKSNSLSLSYSLEYEDGGISLTPLTIPDTAIKNGSYSLTYKVPNELDYKKSYVIRVYAGDIIYPDIQSASKTLKAIPVFDWGEEDFNFNVPVKINNVEVDYVVEQGTKNGWYYRKWSSGFAECWYSATVSGIDVGEFNLDGMYHSGSKGVNFPFTFTSVDYVSATGGSTGNMNIVRPFNKNNSSMTYIVVGMADRSSVSVIVNLEAKGKWK